MDAVEAPPPPPQPPSHFSQQRHFYVAVDRLQFKMDTLVDLLGVARQRPCLPMAVCCSSRDELDAVCSAVSNLPHISLAPLYSDLAAAERALVLEKFRKATMNWIKNSSVQPGDDSEIGKEQQKSHMIVVTDVCLPLLASGELPISARVLINYELPMKKLVCPGNDPTELRYNIPVDNTAFQCVLQPGAYRGLSRACWAAVGAGGRNLPLWYLVFDTKDPYLEMYMRRTTTCLAADGIVINMVVGGEVVTLKSIEESSNLVIAEMPISISEIL